MNRSTWKGLGLCAWLGVVALCVVLGAASGGQASGAAVRPSAENTRVLRLEKKQFPQGTVYSLVVPAQSEFKVIPALSKTLAAVDSKIWQQASPPPVFIINGGYFDPNNSLTTSYVFQGGQMTGDPRFNPQLVNNPKLLPYLPKIFNRTEFRVYLCQKTPGQFQTVYDIQSHQAAVPGSCLLQASLGAGPALLPKVEDVAEGFVDYNSAGKISRDPIGVCARNARSVVGLTANNDVILMMSAQKPLESGASGFTLADMAGLLKARGAVKAMALDGGSSSSFFYENQAVYGKASKEGGWVKRPVKSVLMVVPRKSP